MDHYESPVAFIVHGAENDCGNNRFLNWHAYKMVNGHVVHTAGPCANAGGTSDPQRRDYPCLT